ncbi:uncharacterized protein MYCFIDRAFT_205785 [Pseudocercospora fijiensis CIRAD86]|uniref:Uncharacterized protein n=1 Tax=Pseudocercospora fijiensis (strain CIRAD86) TaxID=383855 RepID=N1Q693_PSEFD|nr:uncharacterized protein MYCFIDRAFT_205785 [Pseudocercospora fijiensis CIRAD86]EME87749.1 hypothetical protein MYCFIDRAFT_205785 [Pseudocercospora fijiensis CIRAD86]
MIQSHIVKKDGLIHTHSFDGSNATALKVTPFSALSRVHVIKQLAGPANPSADQIAQSLETGEHFSE